MNNEITTNTERKHGTVTNFARFTPSMLQSMKYDVGLAMSVQQLDQLRRYYARSARRDPSLDELYLLDHLLTLRGHIMSPIATLSTDSSVIADTYADLMTKRNALGISNAAPTLQELQIIPAHYMERIGKTTPAAAKYLFALGAHSKAELLLNGCTDILCAGDAAMGKITRKSQYIPGSLLVLLPRTPDLTTEQFDSRLTALLEGPAATCVDAGTVIDVQGLIGAICKFGTGAYIDTAALPIKQPCAPEAMCDACHGWALAVVSHVGFGEFTARAKELSIPCIIIGSLASGNKLTVKHERLNSIALDMDFISSLFPCQELCLKPQMTADEFTASSAAAFASDDSMMLATHTAKIGSAPYLTALKTVVCAVSDCVARGAAYGDICISVQLKLPRSMADTALEAILGVYRAQIEYYIPDRDSVVVFDGCSCEPTLTVAATAKQPLQNAPKTDGCSKYLYLLSPRTENGGLPCFKELRRMWNYVTDLSRQGVISNATALWTSDTNAAVKLLGDSMTFEKLCSDDQANTNAYGGILLVSTKKVDGLLLGAVTDRQSTVSC